MTWKITNTIVNPFKSQYQHTNSPNWSPYISFKNQLREFNNRSRYFLFGDHLLILITVSLDNYWILLGENWCWSLSGLKGLNIDSPMASFSICETTRDICFPLRGLSITKQMLLLQFNVRMMYSTKEKSFSQRFHIRYLEKSEWSLINQNKV